MYTFDIAGDQVANSAKYVDRMRLDIAKAANHHEDHFVGSS